MKFELKLSREVIYNFTYEHVFLNFLKFARAGEWALDLFFSYSSAQPQSYNTHYNY